MQKSLRNSFGELLIPHFAKLLKQSKLGKLNCAVLNFSLKLFFGDEGAAIKGDVNAKHNKPTIASLTNIDKFIVE